MKTIMMMMLILRGGSSTKRQKTFDHGTYSLGESSSEQVMKESNPSGLGEEHHHLDQMKNYLKSDIVWESKKEDLSLQIPKKPALVYQSCQKAPPMTLLNQDLFYLKYGNSGPKKYVLSRWEKKRDNPDEVYSESKIVEVYLKKNDIEDLYKMCINGQVKDYRETGLLGSTIIFIRSCVIWERVHDYQLGLESYQQKVNLTTPTITFHGIERNKLLTITSKPVVGLIYENIKKEKRVMIIKDIPKLCDATLIRVLESVEKMNKDVQHGYADLKLSDNDAKYLEFYKEYIKDRLKHQDQMGRWEMYVNGRPLGS
ncbi:hypothetical protein Tco_0343992 [Tanacetum coccineum]